MPINGKPGLFQEEAEPRVRIGKTQQHLGCQKEVIIKNQRLHHTQRAQSSA